MVDRAPRRGWGAQGWRRQKESGFPKVTKPGKKLAAKATQIISGGLKYFGGVLQLANTKIAAIAEHSPTSLRTMIVVRAQRAWRAFALANIALILPLLTLAIVLHKCHSVILLHLPITVLELNFGLVILVMSLLNLLIEFRVVCTPLFHSFNFSGAVAPVVSLTSTLFRAVTQVFSCGRLFTSFLAKVTHKIRWSFGCCYCSSMLIVSLSSAGFGAIVHRPLGQGILLKRLLTLLTIFWHRLIVTIDYSACQGCS